MLGDSMRRRQGGSRRRGERSPRPARPRWKQRTWWLWVAAVLLPLGAGYLAATQVLFPKPALVSEGIAVPQLVGLTEEAARRALLAAGLGTVVPTELPSRDVPAGVVTAQSPLAGQQARARSPVRVAVSSGMPVVAVPDVRGFALQRATQLLRSLGFAVTDSLAESTVPAGRVNGVEPAPGTRLQLPDTVHLIVSTGPPPDTTALDTFRIRSDTITAVRWPAPEAPPIFAREATTERVRTR